MFTHNKYYLWYNSIIEKRKANSLGNKKGEIHHIIPKSLGGTNDKENLIKLTTREHFICHLLLVKFTSGPDHFKMKNAVSKFLQCTKTQDRILNSRQYALCRRYAAEAASFFRTGTKRSRESIERGLATVNERYGGPVRQGATLSENQKEKFKKHRQERTTYDTWFINADPEKKKKQQSIWAKKNSNFVTNNPSLTEEGKLAISRAKASGIIYTPYGNFKSRKDFETNVICNKIGYENIFYLGIGKPIKTRAINRANLPPEWRGKTWREVGFYITLTPNS